MKTRLQVRCRAMVATLAIFASGARAQAQSLPRASDLPLTFFAPVGTDAHVTAVLLTGDGGWAELAKDVAVGLTAHGVGVVGINSRAWLSEPRTPQATTDAVVVAINAARAKWPADRLVLVGYSRGADMAPFVATRLPPALRAELKGLALFGLASASSFEFHLMDLVKDTPRATDLPMLPELEKLRGLRMRCVYGLDESDSGCRDAPADLVVKDGRPGGHHFDRNINVLVAHVLVLLALL